MKRFATIAIMLGATTLLGAQAPAPMTTVTTPPTEVDDCAPLVTSCAELRGCLGRELPSTVECVDAQVTQ